MTSYMPGSLTFNRARMVHAYPHHCEIWRRTQGEDTPLDEPNWGEHELFSSDVPCWFWMETSGGETFDDGTPIVTYQYRLLTAVDTDVTEDDRIGNIVTAQPTPESIFSGMLGISYIGVFDLYQLLKLEEYDV